MSKTKKNKSIEYTLAEAEDMILHLVKANAALKKKGISKNLSLELRGPHGIGKTQSVHDLCKREGFAFTSIKLPQIDDVTYLLGYPRKMFKVSKEGEDKFIESEHLPHYLQQGYIITDHDPKLGFADPNWLSELYSKERSVLFLDEYNRAFPHVIQAVMELINNGSYGDYKLPEGCTVILASNPDDGDYNVNHIDAASQSRFATVNVKFDKDTWITWAIQTKLNDNCINFIGTVPEATNGDVCAREWTDFFYSIDCIDDLQSDNNLNLISQLGVAFVGETSNLFMSYLKNNLDQIPSFDWVFDDKTTEADMLKGLNECSIDPKTRMIRHDIKGILGLRLKIHVRNMDKISDKTLNKLNSILTSDILQPDSKLMFMKDAMHKNANHPHKDKLRALIHTGDIGDLLLEDSTI